MHVLTSPPPVMQPKSLNRVYEKPEVPSEQGKEQAECEDAKTSASFFSAA
jgi:hypothetical protein